jgi:hypothetical protein
MEGLMAGSTIRFLGAFACLLCLGAQLAGEGAKTQVRSALCYVVMETGASSEGNSLYLKKMGVEPGLLKLFAPTRFTIEGKGIKTQAQGDFAYQAEGPELVVKSKALAVYGVQVKYRAVTPPKAQKTIAVDFTLGDLSGAKGLVQPAEKAMLLAAAKAKLSSGTAWVVEMSYAKSSFHAKVELSP